MKAQEAVQISAKTMIVDSKVAAELRRLAEVNAELLVALEMSDDVLSFAHRNTILDCSDVIAKNHVAIAKAKEQQ